MPDADDKLLAVMLDKSAQSYAAELARLENRTTDSIGQISATEEYQRNPWLFRPISAVAQSLASLQVHIIDSQDKRVLIPQLEALLKRPNSYQDWFKHAIAVSSWLQLEGRAIVYMNAGVLGGPVDRPFPDGLQPIEILVLNPNDWRAEVNDQGVLQMWVQSNTRTRIHPTRMIILSSWSPDDPYDGVGAAEAAGISLHLDYWAQAWNAEGFRKGGSHQRLVFETDRPVPSPTILRNWRRRLDMLYTGMKGGWRSIIAHSGMKVKELGGSQRDMQFEQQRRMAREEILAACGVPPSIAGILDLANYSNMEVQDRLFWKLTVLPHSRLIASAYTYSLVSRYDKSLRFTFDLSSVGALQPDIGRALDNVAKMIDVMTVNEVRAYLLASGITQITTPDIPGGDEFPVPRRPVVFGAVPPSPGNGTQASLNLSATDGLHSAERVFATSQRNGSRTSHPARIGVDS